MYRRILVAFDGSKESRVAVDECSHLMQVSGREIHLVCVLKGGFMWSDDFRGSRAWEVWESEIGRVLPPQRYPIVDIPVTHSMFQTVYSVKRILQVPAISQWWRSGETSERGWDSDVVNTRGIFDAKGRLMVLMTHNTDISDTWEREGEDLEYFYTFSPEGYAIAINVMVYVMTH